MKLEKIISEEGKSNSLEMDQMQITIIYIYHKIFEYGRIHNFTFPHSHYIKVEQNFFDTLHIDLKDEHGKYLPFQFGTSTVTLHFKRK